MAQGGLVPPLTGTLVPKVSTGQEQSPWLLRWKLSWSFACVDHAVYVTTECQACWGTVRFRHDAPPERSCENWTDEGEWTYGLGEPCGFPLPLCQPAPVSDDSVLTLQKRVNAWLDGTPTHEDRLLVALAAVLIPLVSPSIVRRGDPLLRYAVLSPRGTTQRKRDGRGPWTDSLRVASAVYAADWFLRRGSPASEVAYRIADLRLLDRRRTPWRMDMAELAYGPSLRPNPFVEPLVHRGLITLGGWLWRQAAFQQRRRDQSGCTRRPLQRTDCHARHARRNHSTNRPLSSAGSAAHRSAPSFALSRSMMSCSSMSSRRSPAALAASSSWRRAV